MRRTEALQGVRMISFRSVLDRHEAGELNQIEAGELLGVSERTFRRWCRRYEDDGETGLLDRRFIGPAISASRRATSTTFWCAIICAAGATPGRSCCFNRKGCWSARRGGERIGVNGHVVPYPE
jgi:hypothetical protein